MRPACSSAVPVTTSIGTCAGWRATRLADLYRLEPACLRPLHEWLAKYERAWNDRLDRVDDYPKELQQQGGQQ